MLRQNTQTGETEQNVPIEKGCIIRFCKVDEKMVTISIESVDYRYYWGSDNKAIIHIPLSKCVDVAGVISKVAGFYGVKLIEDTENLILLV